MAHRSVGWSNAREWVAEVDCADVVINLAAPSPLPNREFMQAIREAWWIKFDLPATSWLLEIGAMALKTEIELILKSRRVAPRRLADQGFVFEFPSWPEAAKDLCQRWREQHSKSQL